jgi:hypothetical protein
MAFVSSIRLPPSLCLFRVVVDDSVFSIRLVVDPIAIRPQKQPEGWIQQDARDEFEGQFEQDVSRISQEVGVTLPKMA